MTMSIGSTGYGPNGPIGRASRSRATATAGSPSGSSSAHSERTRTIPSATAAERRPFAEGSPERPVLVHEGRCGEADALRGPLPDRAPRRVLGQVDDAAGLLVDRRGEVARDDLRRRTGSGNRPVVEPDRDRG